MVTSSIEHINGDQALIDLFNRMDYSAIATDDVRLTRLLRAKDIPYILPALIIYKFFRERTIKRKAALEVLKRLKNFISEDEYCTVKILLEKK